MFKILAVLGALAWIPQLFVLIRNYFTKPVVKIISSNQLEIGYTTYGPIINTSLALVAEKQKALIEKIEIELTHENNDTQKFTWKWFEETLHVVDLPNSGGTMPTRKNQTAIAVNILENELIEKKIGFQQNTFQNDQKVKEQLCTEDLINLIQGGKERSDLKANKSYNDLRTLYENGFNWKVGEYTIKYNVFENGINTPFTLESKFKITALDVTNLKSNITNCLSEVDRIYLDEDIEFPSWNWAYVSVEKK